MANQINTRRRRVADPYESYELSGDSAKTIHWRLSSLVLLIGGALLFLSLMSFRLRDVPEWASGAVFASSQPQEDGNFAGAAGTLVSYVLFEFLGAAAFLLPGSMVWLGIAGLMVNLQARWRPLLGLSIVLVAGSCWLHSQRLFFQSWDIDYHVRGAGGGVGYLSSILISMVLGRFLTCLLALAATVVGFILLFGLTPAAAWEGLQLHWKHYQNRRQQRQELEDMEYEDALSQQAQEEKLKRRSAREMAAARRAAGRTANLQEDELADAAAFVGPAGAENAVVDQAEPLLPASNEPQIIDGAARKTQELDPVSRKLSLAEWRKQRENSNKPAPGSSGMASALSPLSEAYRFYELPDFDLLHWEEARPEPTTDKTALLETQRTIVRTLASFNVAVTPSTITRGPSITRYEIIPMEGLRVKRISELEADLARATKAEYINILAPIPGRDTVGIEIANHDKVPVPLRELLEDPKFTKGKARIPLALGKDVYGETVIADLAAMPHLLVAGTTGSGKSVCINSIIASLLFQFTPDQLRFIMVDPKVVEMQIFNDLPHLIVPVVTEPKKVLAALKWCVNEMDHRYRMFAEEGVRNFESFNSRKRKEPSVGTGMAGKKPKKSADAEDLGPELPLFDEVLPPPPSLSNNSTPPGATKLHVHLRNSQIEPEDADFSVASADYYPHADEEDPLGLTKPLSKKDQALEAVHAGREEDEDEEEDEENGTSVDDYYAEEMPAPANEIPDKVPYIVVIIDELADLMQSVGADVENEIARLTQKARAAGIHLIVATQTPRANVITGVIKANIPSRIAFQVASGLDSRVILDTNGAEKLVGKGDMLYLPPGTSKLARVQGAFITDDEISALVAHCKSQGQPLYDASVQKTISEAATTDDPSDQEQSSPEEEEMVEKCIEVIVQEGIASTSRLQRRLRLGYTRAARMMDILEKRGIVGPADGIKPREILIARDGEY